MSVEGVKHYMELNSWKMENGKYQKIMMKDIGFKTT